MFQYLGSYGGSAHFNQKLVCFVLKIVNASFKNDIYILQ